MAPIFTGFRFGFGSGAEGSVVQSFGGTILTPGNGYTYHVFLSSEDLILGQSKEADILIVAGGGSGGYSYYAGGGGGALVRSSSAITLPSGTYPVVVGEGGPLAPSTLGVPSSKGSNSSFDGVTAIGGGSGASGAAGYPLYLDRTRGGSGGGNHGYSNDATARTKLPQPVPAQYTAYGNDGGTGGAAALYTGGGGGGAGGAGSNAPAAYGGPGGIGLANPIFPGPIIAPAIPTAPIPDAPINAGGPGPVPNRSAFQTVVGPSGLYAGGGGGALYYLNTDPLPGGKPSGGPGGGADGAGNNNPPGPPIPAVITWGPARNSINYTGGGGGGGNYGANSLGSAGANGIVIVRYLA
jgi:fibronectin-binding autotransporter adhesin